MEKYGVVTEKAEKCPICGKDLEVEANVSKCPVHGTTPFEKEKIDEKERSREQTGKK